jgi:long-chain acyl-CoA synthetase
MGVNTLYAGLVHAPEDRRGGLLAPAPGRRRRRGRGGAVSDKWKAITGQFIREGYGLSETSPVLSFNPASIKEFSGTTGLPLPAPTSSCSTTDR